MSAATAELEFALAPGGRTVLGRSRVCAPLAFTRAFDAADRPGAAEAWLQSLAGGLVAGEEVTVRIDVRAGASAVVAPQSATLVFGVPTRAARPPAPARLAVELAVAEGATLEWLPRPTVLLPGANLVSSIVVRAGAGARVLLGEAYVQHRPVGEDPTREAPVGFASMTASLVLERDGRVAAADRQRTRGSWSVPAHGVVWAIGWRVDDGGAVPLLLAGGVAAGALPNGAGIGVRAAGRPEEVRDALEKAIGILRAQDPGGADADRLPS